MFFRETSSSDVPSWPLLPLRDVVVFPHTPMSLIVGRPRSLAAVHAAGQRPGKQIFLVPQCDGDRLHPTADELREFGTLATIEQTLHLPDGNTKLLVKGHRRARVIKHLSNDAYFEVELQVFEPDSTHSVEVQALARTVKTTFERYAELNRAVPPEMLKQVQALDDVDRLSDVLIAPLHFKLAERLELLELVEAGERLERIYKTLLTEIEFLQVEQKLRSRVQRERESSQRDQWLNEQMKSIQKEIGDKDTRTELEELTAQLQDKLMPTAVRRRADKELRKLSQMNAMSAEAAVIRNYLDWILQLPWMLEQPAQDDSRLDIHERTEHASKVLDDDHFGLDKVKERILEYLAVSSLVERMRGPILCLVGPPGVGKTSLARSIARATTRPFVKVALGGVRDEAEIRGHRRTYIGAMPGKLIHGMKRAGRIDAVMLLDEIDKLSSDFRGDPASALLEVLDHEQNTEFSDHYLDLDFDLSHVMFICTANSLQGIPLPLRDRLEIIEINGYTEREKTEIARRYLIPRQLELNGIDETNMEISAAALQSMIRRHTKESGVRDLERQLARVCRKAARRVVEHGVEARIEVAIDNLDRLLGPPRFRVGQREAEDTVGLVKGLAVSPWGGELLNIEVATVPGSGKLILTGRLGDWLKESATTALTYIRSRAETLGLEPDFHESIDIHIHYPGNPLKTDGPSAGIAMATALVSALTGRPARADTAMTGEITLRGRVLQIGGLKEKVLAAHRGNITKILAPASNRPDLIELPPKILENMEVITLSHMDEVIKEALTDTQTP